MISLLFSQQFFVTGLGIIAGIFTAGSMLPQVIKTIKEKKAAQVSVLMLVVLNTGVALWTFYGILKDDLPIILTNGFSLLINITMLILRWKFRERK